MSVEDERNEKETQLYCVQRLLRAVCKQYRTESTNLAIHDAVYAAGLAALTSYLLLSTWADKNVTRYAYKMAISHNAYVVAVKWRIQRQRRS